MTLLPRLLTALLGLALIAACGGNGQNGPQPAAGGSPTPDCHNGTRTALEQRTTPPPQTIDASKTYVATVHTSRGDFSLTLAPHDAPVTVNNFVFLAQQGFYDCLTFHRVEPGFVVQGGDPLGNGTGGLGYRLPAEKTATPWTKGSLGMAANAAGVSGCQFFVLLGDAPWLESGVYNRFGAVASGADVVQALRPGDEIKSIDIAAQ